jgi:flagellar motor switch protein FliG
MASKRKKLTGVQKAAIIMVSMGPDHSSKVLRLLSDEMIERVTVEIANMERVSQNVQGDVMNEFIEMVGAQTNIMDGGIEYARDLLQKALGSHRAKEIMDVLMQMQQQTRPFALARKADPVQLANVLVNEHPQTISLILCYLQPDKAGLVLSELDEDLQADVAERIATINRTSPAVIKRIENIMNNKLSSLVSEDLENVGGVKTLVEILNSVDRGTEKNILNELEKEQPDLADVVRTSLFVFEDIVTLDKGSVQRLLREVNNEDLVLALKGASEEVVKLIFDNVSKRAGETLKEDIEFLGPVRLSAVEEAQRNIVNTIRRLEETGEIILSRGDSDAIVV